MIEPQTRRRTASLPKTYQRNWGLAVLYALSLVTFGLLVAYGWDYYTTPLVERPHHPQYWDLKPGGSLGRTYGIIGASLMTLMMTYSLRKRVKVLRSVGQLRWWLDFHIYCGVMGPLLIVLHSSLKVTGVVALSFWSMVLVATSGILGRYLYLQIPRRRSGDAMSLAEVEQLSEGLNAKLTSQYGVTEKALHRLDGVVKRTVDGSAGLLRILASLPLGSARLQWQVKALTRGMSTQHRAELQKLLQDRAQLSRRLLLWERLQELFHHWHVFHKPFAIIMYIFAAVHIAVAIATGYGFS
ncbi:MAG: hypothetical protein OES32_02300 [Acidobacteriota bacterium]|nr:hypothetical protein [Acidobacteriota bacterium]MDH3522392.1 hypothetical protein [Acidobacteriota bacterium]